MLDIIPFCEIMTDMNEHCGSDVVIIGAGISRQGTGPWIANILHHQGYRIAAVIGRDMTRAKKASDELAQRFGILTKPLASLSDISSPPSLVVIASPAATHREYLETCLQNKWPVFCEKPFIWDNARNNVQDAITLASQIDTTKTPIWLNTQWIESLESYRCIYPAVDFENLTDFSWEMSPSSKGIEMIIDAVPHLLSMMLHVAPEGRIENINVTWEGTQYCRLQCSWAHKKRAISTVMTLRSTSAQPRHFAYAFNGHRVERRINEENYSFSFASQHGLFPIEDPLKARLLKCLPKVVKSDDNMMYKQCPPASATHLVRSTAMLDQMLRCAQ
jgi:hypothetical protein